MIMINRCAVTELFADQCAHCVAPSKPTPADPFSTPTGRVGRWFSSSYPGECSGCADRFVVGEYIRADGEGGYLAECCGLADQS